MGAFGDLFKDRRIELGKTLREFCLEYDLDPGNISKLERGKLAPPKDIDLLKKYAEHLRIKEGSNLWHEFVDKASAEAGVIPKDILDNQEVLSKLPIFFRMMRGKKIDREGLKALIEKIKRV